MKRCEDMDNKIGFMKIMQSVDAFFPIGAFTLSNGLESYVLEDWIRTPLYPCPMPKAVCLFH